jgi:hypothetical protein
MIGAAMTHARKAVAVALAAVAAGCSLMQKPPPITETNVYPSDYKSQIATFLSTVLIDRADFLNAQIATPVLKQVGASEHYVVCVQFPGRAQHREKVAIYLAANINQIVDADAGQCAGSAYQPFPELAALVPRK